MGIKVGIHRDKVPRQPGPRVDSAWSPGDLERLTAGYEDRLGPMLGIASVSISSSRRLGDISRTARMSLILCTPIQARYLTQTTEGQRVLPCPMRPKALIEKIGEARNPRPRGPLLHDEPVVYVSDHLPAMDELRGAAETRPLDKFETSALSPCRAGRPIRRAAERREPAELGRDLSAPNNASPARRRTRRPAGGVFLRVAA